jgi:mevalonate kinase
MQSVASAPGKAILFGEHAVVFGKPAIAFAVDKRATISIKKGNNINNTNNATFESPILNLKAELDLDEGNIKLSKGNSGIVKYVLEAVLKRHDGSPIDIILDMEMPIGAGLGSSAAVTVATLAALDNYHERDISVSKIAKMAHEIEIKVQGSASPLDTTISAFGGIIYLSENSEVIPLKSDLEDSIVIGYTSSRGNTGEMVAGVKKRRDSNPEIMDPVIDSMGKITKEAKSLLNLEHLSNENMESLGELMNINHGLLDAIGVNTLELSNMVYIARKSGAIGSKITGAGGGGSIIALCNGNGNQVIDELRKKENAIKADFSREGIIIHK